VSWSCNCRISWLPWLWSPLRATRGSHEGLFEKQTLENEGWILWNDVYQINAMSVTSWRACWTAGSSGKLNTLLLFLLTQWSGVLFGKLIVAQLAKKISAFYVIWRLITISTIVCCCFTLTVIKWNCYPLRVWTFISFCTPLVEPARNYLG